MSEHLPAGGAGPNKTRRELSKRVEAQRAPGEARRHRQTIWPPRMLSGRILPQSFDASRKAGRV